MVTLTEKDHPPEPEVNKAQREPIREPDEKEPDERGACAFCNLAEWTFKDQCRDFPTPEQRVVQTQGDPV